MSHKLPHIRLLVFTVQFIFFLLQAAAQDSNPVQNPAVAKTPRNIRCSPSQTGRAFGQIALSTLPGVPRTAALQSSIRPAKGHSFGAFWKVGDGYTSTLILRNKESQNPIVANVVLFSHDGSIEQKTQLTVGANSVGRLPLKNLIKDNGNSSHWGGLMLEFPAVSAARSVGNVVIENYKKGVIFDLPLSGGFRYDTENALFTPWWLIDKGTDGIITLFNQSDQDIVVSPSVIAGGVERGLESLALGSHQAKKLSIREILRSQNIQSNKGAIALRYSGPAHALAPALLLANLENGFSLVSPFNAKHDKAESGEVVWHFPDVFLLADPRLGFSKDEKLTAYALLSNATKVSLSVQFTAFAGESAKKISLPVTPLKPLETRLINLSQFVSGLLPSDLAYTSLAVSHKGEPGDLGLTIFSVGQTKDFVSRSEGLVRSGQVIDSTYWDISGDLVALLLVQNASETQVQTKATLYYETEQGTASYVLPPIEVPANGSRILNLKQIILAGLPDSAGHTIPENTTFGTLTLEVADKSSHGLIFGGSTSFDPVKGRYGIGLFPPNCDLCSTCEDCIEATETGGVCEPSCSDPICCAPPLPNPQINSISPSQIGTGRTSVTLKLTGVFNSNPSISVSGTGITVGQLTFNQDGSLNVPLTISSTAQITDYSVTESDDGGTSNSVKFSIVCAIPQNLTWTEANLTDGTESFQYSFSSSTGDTKDLVACTAGESVFYPGSSNPYIWPLPMVQQTTNPTAITGKATNPFIVDKNFPPGSYQKPYLANGFTATQRLWYICGCANNGALTNFIPDFPIVRKVFMDSDGFWKYQIIKQGFTNTVKLPNQ